MNFGGLLGIGKDKSLEDEISTDESDKTNKSQETEQSNQKEEAGIVPNLDNTTPSKEEVFFAAIENGDISIFMDMLSQKQELNLDINHVNADGVSAIRLATTNGYSGIVEQLLKHGARVGDALLRAVDVGFVETVKKICSHVLEIKIPEDRQAILDCHSENDDYHVDITPMILAAQRNDFAIVQVLRDSGCKIKPIGSNKKQDSSTATDDLQKSVGALEVYKGLASEAYLIQVNEDPVDVAFTLSKKLYDVGQKDVEFRPSYIELADNVDRTVTKLISYARNTVEILSILTHQEVETNTEGRDGSNIGPLPKISRAIDFNQKHFVAHPNCQQAVLAKFYGRLAFLRDRSTFVRMGFFLMMILGFPFVTLMYLYVPSHRVRRFVRCPYSKFLLKLASDVFLVLLLIVDTIVNDHAKSNDPSLRKWTRVFLLLWIIGIASREIKSIYIYRTPILTQINHLRDIILVILFLVGIGLEVASYYSSNQDMTTYITSETRRDTSLMLSDRDVGVDQLHKRNSDYILLSNISDNNSVSFPGPIILNRAPRASIIRGSNTNTDDKLIDCETNQGPPNFLNYNWWHPKLISTTLFAMSTVIALLRMLSYLVVSDVLGPLQISMGSMITNTGHFFLLMAVVMIAFGVGLTYIYAYYSMIKSFTCAENPSDECDSGKFNNLFFTLVFLYWSALGLEDQEGLQISSQAQVLEIAGLVLYASFFVLLVIVMLNALIAVMSGVYNTVEENADLEWKFHSTIMWMGILCDDDVAPPPFNLLPPYETVRFVIVNCLRKICGQKCQKIDPGTWKMKKTTDVIADKTHSNEDGDGQYKRVINKLIERYVSAKTAGEANVNAEVSFTDILGLKNDLQNLKLELFLRLYETSDDINKTFTGASGTRDNAKTAKSVLEKAEEINERVDETLLESIRDFKTTVEDRKNTLLRKLKPRLNTDSGILSRLTSGYETAKSRIEESYESARSRIMPDEPTITNTANVNSAPAPADIEATTGTKQLINDERLDSDVKM